jgi:group I intron endonuclease
LKKANNIHIIGFFQNTMASIYKFTNKNNGKVYIGKTVQDPYERKRQHCKDAENGSNTVLHKSLRKYGVEAFEFEIIATAQSDSELSDLEINLIADHDCCVLDGADKGYNMTRGGDGIGSETGRLSNLKRIANGTHPWAGKLGSERNKAMIAAGTHPLAGENGSRHNRARLAAGTHHCQGEVGSKRSGEIQNRLLAEGRHHFQGEAGSKRQRIYQHQIMNEGRHHTQKEISCPHCYKIGKSNAMYRWHFDQCKMKKA